MPDPAAALRSARDARGVPLAELVHSVVCEYAGERGPLLPVLHRLQQLMGFIHPDAIALLASELKLSRADVHGVVIFYRDLRDRAEGRPVRICRADACQSAGAEALMEHARNILGAGVGETTADGRYRLDQVFCLGICVLGPAVEVDGTVHGRVTPGRFDELLGEGHG
jgi:formate dehydrogenase subunit gamma